MLAGRVIPSPGRVVSRRAHAKLNLGLAVLGRRDDGFSEIDTIFARLELFDLIRVEPAESFGGLVESQGIDAGDLTMDEENLALRAARAFVDSHEGVRPVTIELQKQIPIAAGLGGGSSDAAAVLRAMEELYPAATHSSSLAGLAESLGSDVPFFLGGESSARAGGRGELLERLRLPRLPVVLVNPRVSVSAREAYALVREYGPPLEADAIVRELEAGEEPSYRNDLEPGVTSSFPVVETVLAALRHSDLRGVQMSGSGPTCFGIAGDDERAAGVAAQLKDDHPEWWVWWGQAAV